MLGRYGEGIDFCLGAVQETRHLTRRSVYSHIGFEEGVDSTVLALYNSFAPVIENKIAFPPRSFRTSISPEARAIWAIVYVISTAKVVTVKEQSLQIMVTVPKAVMESKAHLTIHRCFQSFPPLTGKCYHHYQ